MQIGPSLPEIRCAASLAHHKLHEQGGPYPFAGWLCETTLADVDLSSVPPEHLDSMMSCIGRTLKISNIVRGKGLVRILNNVISDLFFIENQTLGVEETEALVKAMESEKVYRGMILLLREGVTLDIKTLTSYSGQGQCHEVSFKTDRQSDTETKYRDDLKTWAISKNWVEKWGSTFTRYR